MKQMFKLFGVSFLLLSISLFASNMRPSECILTAARNGDLYGVRAALTAGQDINARDPKKNTPLMLATKGKNKDECLLVVQQLIDLNFIKVNLANKKGRTALMLAVIRNRIGIAELLLGVEGINVSTQDKGGDTALDYAKKSLVVLKAYDASQVRIERTCKLIGQLEQCFQKDSGKIDDDWQKINVVDEKELALGALKIGIRKQNQILWQALKKEWEDVTKKALKYGAEVNCHDASCIGDTPFMYVLKSSGEAVKFARLLLEQPDIDIGKKNYSGDSALSIVQCLQQESGRDELLNALNAKLQLK